MSIVTKEVKTSVGTFVLKKPKAGIRNKAMIKAETGFGGFKTTVLLMELVPKCIIKRPIEVDQDVPIEQIVDSLETEDYDLIADVTMQFINFPGSKNQTPEEVMQEEEQIALEENEKKKQSGDLSMKEESPNTENIDSV